MSDLRKIIEIDYKNWRGETRKRHVNPTGVVSFENNERHPETQWMLSAADLDDNGKIKEFALSGFIDAAYARGLEDAANWCGRQASALYKLHRESPKREAFAEAHSAIREMARKPAMTDAALNEQKPS